MYSVYSVYSVYSGYMAIGTGHWVLGDKKVVATKMQKDYKIAEMHSHCHVVQLGRKVYFLKPKLGW